MMESQGRKKKPYSAPSLTKLTPEQARKLVADRRNCSEEEAADFLKSLRQTVSAGFDPSVQVLARTTVSNSLSDATPSNPNHLQSQSGISTDLM
jgi:hypothetical protein